jgi:predicted acyltransferase
MASMPTHAASDSLAAAEPAKSSSNRLMSLDALRGFDMLWIIGGSAVIKSLNAWKGGPFLGRLTEQFAHVEWNGFHFEDLIFPLFLFISGVTMPFSLTRRIEQGGGRGALYWRILRRVVLLVFLGMVYNGFLKFDWPNTRYPSVLGRIGLAYGLAAVIVINTQVRSQVGWMLGILLAYWAAMMLIPVPGVGAGVLTMEGSLAGYVDRHLLPGTLAHPGVHDPEGLLSTIPAVSTALLGALAGHWLRSARPRRALKVLGLAAAGGVCLGLARLWNIWFPINKNLWSSSFVLYAGGWSLLLLTLFYLLIDVWGLRRWAFVFVVIGLNPITIYITKGQLIDFNLPAHFLFDGALRHADKPLRPVLFWLAVLAVEWLFLYFLYRKKVFLKV